ncbi:hypothetical protein QVD17_31991 [Tagetes erecta]|uniref:Uncharacterized protein n=1 Tax=Tagetes erecta TaxID=13708 RepID=A0AAD8K8T8_TARER|nr:hypothetical protein QVD17_31991 [Tagetes erecta]
MLTTREKGFVFQFISTSTLFSLQFLSKPIQILFQFVSSSLTVYQSSSDLATTIWGKRTECMKSAQF